MIRTRSILKSALATAMFGAALMAPAAHASIKYVMDFNDITPITLNGNESVAVGDYTLTAKDSPLAQLLGFSGGVGLTINGSESCTVAACPSGNATQYYAGINDGSVTLTAKANDFQITGLNFAFLSPLAGLPDFSYGQLVLTGAKVGSGFITASRNFVGQDGNGDFTFDHWDLGIDWAKEHLTSLTISACIFNDSNACVNSADDPAFNMAQFAIDDLQLSTVPEPGSIALLMLGAAGMGMAARRRRAAK